MGRCVVTVGMLCGGLAACTFEHGAISLDAAVVAGDTPSSEPDAATAPAMIQEKTAHAVSGTPLMLVLDTPPHAGHTLIMTGAALNNVLSGVSGGGVATWTRATRSTIRTNSEIWYGVTDGSSSTVSISLTGNTAAIWMNVSEWSGLASTAVLDGATAATGTSSPADAGSVTTTNAHDLLVFGVGDGASNTFGSPAGSWTAMTPISGGTITQASWYQLVTVTGTFHPTVSETAHFWDATLAAFRAAPN